MNPGIRKDTSSRALAEEPLHRLQLSVRLALKGGRQHPWPTEPSQNMLRSLNIDALLECTHKPIKNLTTCKVRRRVPSRDSFVSSKQPNRTSRIGCVGLLLSRL